VLTAWLYQVTRRTAIDVVRREARRQLREQIASEMNAKNATATDWTHIEPLLDEAMHALDDTDRAAVLLRYFENKSLREVGQTLGTSEDAAQKRVSRAVERLREFFAKHGVTVGASGLVVVISANAVQAAPVGLAVTISAAAALAGTTIATTATATAIKAIAMTTLQKTIVTATVAVLAGAGIYEASQASKLREQVQTIQQQQAPLAEQIHQLQRERNDAAYRLGLLADEIERVKGNSTDLLKLRGEVTRLMGDSQELAHLKAADAQRTHDPMESATKDWLAKVNLLKQRLEQMPEKKIPELKYLTDQDWLHVAERVKLDTDAGVRMALSGLRQTAKAYIGRMMRQALGDYTKANGGQLPTDLSELQPYFPSPVDDATLQRYQMTKTGNVSNLQPDDTVIAEKASVDDQYDTRMQTGINSTTTKSVGSRGGLMVGAPVPGFTGMLGVAIAGATVTAPVSSGSSPDPQEVAALEPAWKAFSAANNGQEPKEPSDLLPYLTTSEQQAAYQKLLKAYQEQAPETNSVAK
jgi:hypothetical protein